MLKKSQQILLLIESKIMKDGGRSNKDKNNKNIPINKNRKRFIIYNVDIKITV